MRKYTGSTRQEEMAKLTRCYVRLRNLTLAELGLVVAALITAIVKAMLPSVLCLLGMGLLRVTLHRKWQQNYRQAITDAVLACSVGPKLDQFELSSKGGTGITPGDVLEAELFPVREGIKGNIGFYQGISGTWRGMDISLNDTTLMLPQQDGQKKLEFACGVWIRVVLPKDTGRNFRILSKDLLPDGLRRSFMKSLPLLTKRDEQKAGFQEKLYMYEERQMAAPFLPVSNTVISAVSSLFRKCSGKPAVSVKGNVVNVFLRDQFLAQNYPANSQPDEKILQYDPIPEFRDVLKLAQSL